MWRPENWKNVYPIPDRALTGDALHNAFEAGADAMLEALKAKGMYFSQVPRSFGEMLSIQGKGCWLVFIPDEEIK